jgi:hypothetical protein
LGIYSAGEYVVNRLSEEQFPLDSEAQQHPLRRTASN